MLSKILFINSAESLSKNTKHFGDGKNNGHNENRNIRKVCLWTTETNWPYEISCMNYSMRTEQHCHWIRCKALHYLHCDYESWPLLILLSCRKQPLLKIAKALRWLLLIVHSFKLPKCLITIYKQEPLSGNFFKLKISLQIN